MSVSPDQATPKGYTEADVELVAGAVEVWARFIAADGYAAMGQRSNEEIAEQALAALAGAGRLLPEPTTGECGCPIVALRCLSHRQECPLARRTPLDIIEDELEVRHG